jgi:hypothetical protein
VAWVRCRILLDFLRWNWFINYRISEFHKLRNFEMWIQLTYLGIYVTLLILTLNISHNVATYWQIIFVEVSFRTKFSSWFWDKNCSEYLSAQMEMHTIKFSPGGPCFLAWIVTYLSSQ